MRSFSRLQSFLLVALCANLVNVPSSFAHPIIKLNRRIETSQNISGVPIQSQSQQSGGMKNSSSPDKSVNNTKPDTDSNSWDGGNSTVRMVPLMGSRLDSYRPDTYIVLLYPNTTASSYIQKFQSMLEQESANTTLSLSEESKIGYVYSDNVINGFSARLVGKGLDFVGRSPEVEAIVPDTKMTTLPITDSIHEILTPSNVHSESSDDSVDSTDSGGNYLIQRGTAPWNLQRISQRAKIIANSSMDVGKTTYNYYHQVPDGNGTVVYVLDTGVRASHEDFEGRVEFAAVFGGYAMWDGNGHGTHCAGVITGHRWGVAKQAKVRAIKVLSDAGDGATSDIIAGIQFILEQYHSSGYQPTIASLSLGGHRNDALDRAVQKAIDQGVHFVVAAGNQNVNSCQSSPAACPDANVVAASDIGDARAPYSNWGSCVDLFAPGSNITSTWYTSNTATARISGTSMAAPHVAALMAFHLSQNNMTTKAMSDMLKRNANHGVISLRADDVSTREAVAATPNLLIYNTIG